MSKGDLGRFWALIRPYALPRTSKLVLVAVLGAVAATMQGGVLLLLGPLWTEVLFPTERLPGVAEEVVEGSFFGDLFDRLTEFAGALGDFEDERLPILLTVVAIAFAMALVGGTAQYGYTWLSRRIGFEMIVDLRLSLARHLMNLSVRYHSQRKFGDLLSRVSTDVATTLHAVNLGLKSFIQEPLLGLVYLGVAVLAAPGPALIVVLALPILAVPLGRLSRRVRRGSKKSLTSLGASMQALTQMFQGVRTVKSFGAEEHELENYRKLNRGYLRASMKMVRATAFAHAWTSFYATAGVALLILLLGGLTIGFGLFEDGGAMVKFFVAVGAVNNIAKTVTRNYTKVQESVGASDRLAAILAEPPDVTEHEDAHDIDGLGSGVRFEDVSFTYPESDEPALQDVTLELRPGETLALVGPSGAGKSTLMDLVARFIDPTAGRVTADGQDLRDLKLSSWIAQYALVGQVPFLFHAPIRENLAYGRLDADQADVEAAARAANIHDFIQSLPAGYDTDVADMGSRLSGGQRQRITIARALLKGAPLLLLDEATSALDSESEAEVQRALDALMADRTVLVIAHRLSTIRNADRIAVLNRGRLVELGNHEELLAKGGTYARLHALQAAGAATNDDEPLIKER
jgi:subfamily B ATP-binding cassette protein MsbA